MKVRPPALNLLKFLSFEEEVLISELVDVTLVCEGDQFQTHKVILRTSGVLPGPFF